MIEKFNFYDLYGYFLPGFALIAVIWLPFGVIGHVWPAGDWSSALATAVLAYISGHLLQMFTKEVIPSRDSKDEAGRDRYPSEVLLDHAVPDLSEDAQKKIASLAKDQFGLELDVLHPGSEIVDNARRTTFLLARQVLIREKAANYAEQFQGMYALTRGLTAIFAVGCFYWAGWSAGIIHWGICLDLAVILIVISIVGTISLAAISQHRGLSFKKKAIVELASGWIALVAFPALGYILGSRQGIQGHHCALLAFLSGVALAASRRAYSAYKFFATPLQARFGGTF